MPKNKQRISAIEKTGEISLPAKPGFITKLLRRLGFVVASSGLVASFVFAVVVFSSGNAFSGKAQAANPEGTQGAKAGEGNLPGTVSVVELFTSHGCYSCPPADKLFGEIIEKRENVIALEYHVDYWDTLIHGNAGSFKDPFSDPDYTLRQQAYNNRYMLGRRGVYTPQMIVNGSYATVGSQRQFVDHALDNNSWPTLPLEVVSSEPLGPSDEHFKISVSIDAGMELLPDSARLWLVVFHREKETDITGGENKSLKLVNHHIVSSMQPIGEKLRTIRRRATENGDSNSAEPLVLAAQVDLTLAPGQGCAVLLQDELPGEVYAAGYCAESLWR